MHVFFGGKPPLLPSNYRGSHTCSSLDSYKYFFILAAYLVLPQPLKIRYCLQFLSAQVCSPRGWDLLAIWLSPLPGSHLVHGKCLCIFWTHLSHCSFDWSLVASQLASGHLQELWCPVEAPSPVWGERLTFPYSDWELEVGFTHIESFQKWLPRAAEEKCVHHNELNNSTDAV